MQRNLEKRAYYHNIFLSQNDADENIMKMVKITTDSTLRILSVEYEKQLYIKEAIFEMNLAKFKRLGFSV
jgi:hypothetical protein